MWIVVLLGFMLRLHPRNQRYKTITSRSVRTSVIVYSVSLLKDRIESIFSRSANCRDSSLEIRQNLMVVEQGGEPGNTMWLCKNSSVPSP